jgi:exosome complex RNA-binding protein Rrp4
MINNYEKYEKELMRNVKLEDYLSGSLSELDSKIVMAGDLITSEEGFMHGSGTIMRNKCIYSCIIGRVTKTNRLLTVNSIK